MVRILTDDFKEASAQDVVRVAFLSEFEFDEGDLRFWTGYGNLEYDGKIFTGSGNLLKISPAQETQNLEATNTVWELSGIPESIVSVAMSSDYSGRPCRLWIAFFNSAWELIANPMRRFSGKMDTMPILDDPQNPIIRLTAENDLNRLTRSQERRWTHEEQQIDYAGDMFFEFVPQMQDREVLWS